MRIAIIDDLINRKKTKEYPEPEPLLTETAENVNLGNCINCPGLCLKCVKHLFVTTHADFEENNCRLIYVASGKIRLIFPNARIEKQLDANGIILIPHETKVVIKNENDVLANFVVKCLDAVKARMSENIDPLTCSTGRMFPT